jgi:hypothetical protein
MAANEIMLPGAIANGDLSTRQWYAVRQTGSTIATGFEIGPTTAATQRPVGILTNNPNTSGQAAEVVIEGIVKAEYGDTITIGQPLTVDALGRLVAMLSDTGTAISKQYIIGEALEAGTSGDIRSIRLHAAYIHSSTA